MNKDIILAQRYTKEEVKLIKRIAKQFNVKVGQFIRDCCLATSYGENKKGTNISSLN